MKRIAMAIIFMFMLTTLFGLSIDNVEADGTYVVLADWEDADVETHDISSGYVTTKMLEDANSFYVKDDSCWTNDVGDNYFYVSRHMGSSSRGKGWINLSHDLNYISNIHLFFKTSGSQNGNDNYDYIRFYEGGIKVLDIRFQTSGTNGHRKLWAMNETGDYNTSFGELYIYTTLCDGSEGWLNISHIEGNMMNYSYDKVSGGGDSGYLVSTSSNLSDWTSFDSIYFDFTGSNDCGFAFDTLAVTYSSASGVDYSQIPTYSQYMSFGSIDNGCYLYGVSWATDTNPYRYIEWQRQVPINGVIKEVQMEFTSDFFNDDRTSSHLNLWMNCNNLGSPDTTGDFVNIYGTSVKYCLWQDCNIALNGSYPSFELGFSGGLGGTGSTRRYWWGIGTACYNKDSDADGNININLHNNTLLYGDCNYGGTANNPHYEPSYRVWYQSNVELQENSLLVYPKTIDVGDSTSIVVHYNMTEDAYVTVDNATGVERLNETLTKTEQYFTYTPTSNDDAGTNIINVTENGTVLFSQEITVNSVGDDTYLLWVDNNRPLVSENFKIYYKIPDGQYGAIRIYEGSYIHETWDVEGSSSQQSLNYKFDDAGTYIIKLFRVTGGNSYFKEDETIIVGGTVEKSNYINVNYDSVTLGDSINIYGTHNYQGFDISVRVNPTGQTYDVSGRTEFSIPYSPQVLGDYQAVLILNGNTTLDSVSFTCVASGGESEQGHSTLPTYFDIFSNEEQFLIGIVIILFCTALPLYMSYRWGNSSGTIDRQAFSQMFKTQKEIDSLVYTMFAVCGFAIDIYLGLFDLWMIVLLAFVFSLIIGWEISNQVGGN